MVWDNANVILPSTVGTRSLGPEGVRYSDN